MSEKNTVTREELYARVWAIPLRKLAKEYGVSNYVFARICQRLNVPRPSPGHWKIIAVGKTIRRPKLPPISEGTPESAVIESVLGKAGTIVQHGRRNPRQASSYRLTFADVTRLSPRRNGFWKGKAGRK